MQLDLSIQQKNKICFNVSGESETLYVYGKPYSIDLGAVTISLLELTQDCFSQINQILEFLESIDDVQTFLSNLSELGQLRKKVFAIDAPDFLKEILMWQSLASAQYPDLIEEDKYILSAKENTDWLNSSRPSERAIYLIEKNAIKWRCLQMMLEGTEISCSSEQAQKLLECFSLYIEHFKNIAHDAYWLNKDLIGYFNGTEKTKETILKKIYNIGHQISIVSRYNNGELYKKKAEKKYSRVYAVPGLYELITLEFELLFERGYQYKKCALCGRDFLSRKSDSVFCKNPNAMYDNKACSEVGSDLRYREKRKDDPIRCGFDAYDARYRQWVSANHKYKDSHIQGDIATRYQNWRDRAKQIITAYDNGEISCEEGLKMMTPPDPKDRSPVLTDYLMNIKVEKEIEKNKALRKNSHS